MPDNPLRQGILKVGQANPSPVVQLDPRPVAVPRHPTPQPASEGLSELHDSLRFDPVAAAAERTADIILSEAKAQRDSLLDNATREAQEARERMERELAAMQEAAELELAEQRAQLVDELRRELEAQYASRYLSALTQLESAAAHLREQTQAMLKTLEIPALNLVLHIAHQLLGVELSQQPAILTGLIARAFASLQPQPSAVLELHPQVLDQLTRDSLLADSLASSGFRLEQIELRSNPALRHDQFELQAGMARISFDFTAQAWQLIAEVEKQAELVREAGTGAPG